MAVVMCPFLLMAHLLALARIEYLSPFASNKKPLRLKSQGLVF
jgi:hypothetical protein